MLFKVTQLLLGLTITFGPLLALLVLLNHRDQRQGALRDMVLAALPLRELRGLIAMQISCALWSRRGVVKIDMLACTREQIWDVMTRLSQILPADVQLVVNGSVDSQFTSTFTLETTGRNLFHASHQAPAVTA